MQFVGNYNYNRLKFVLYNFIIAGSSGLKSKTLSILDKLDIFKTYNEASMDPLNHVQ